MIYIIDDKKSRQRDLGWDEARFKKFSNSITPIWSVEELGEKKESIVKSGNIILFHESFFSSEGSEKQKTIETFKSSLHANADNLYITYFSGSKCGRFAKEKVCMLPPDVLYTNLNVFINKLNEGDIDFHYLAFGENFIVEETLRLRLKTINENNVGGERRPIANNIFFAVTSDDAVEPPFNNVQVTEDWDWFDADVTDEDLDELVKGWFKKTQYDAIYIPLCFGDTMSDFMGLRLAMHIRFTSTLNQTTPIFVYGVATYEEMKQNHCFDILKTSTVRLIGCDNSSFIESVELEIPECDLLKEVKLIHLDMPTNIGRHSLANQWGADVLARVIGRVYEPDERIIKARKSLYFKYIMLKTNLSIEFADSLMDTVPELVSCKGKKILFIDDEADKGWEVCLREIFSDCNEKDFEVVNSRIAEYKDLPTDVREKIRKSYYDLYIIDLRLLGDVEDENNITELFSGFKLLEQIKKENRGNQIIFLTASNKAWNLKNLIEYGANGYYIKESPELMLPIKFSVENYDSFKKDVENAFKNKFKRELYLELELLQKSIKKSKKFKERGISEELTEKLWRTFMPYMIKIQSKNDCASSYLILFGVLEFLKNVFQHDIDRKGNDSMTHIINEIYMQIGGGESIWQEIEIIVNERNDYIHPKKGKSPQLIYKPEGLTKLFNIVNIVISSLL